MYAVPGLNQGPRLNRRIDLSFSGDWGQANFHRVCSWLCQEVCDRAEPGSNVAIWNSSGGSDVLRNVASGKRDFGISTPAAFARMALSGIGPFEGKALTNLRAIGVLPQRDRLLFAVDAKFGVSTYAELRQIRPKLNLVCSGNDGANFIGYATEMMLAAAGVPLGEIKRWGGRVQHYARPEQCVAIALAGEADAIVQEAIMTPGWKRLMEERDMKLLPLEQASIDALKRDLGWEPAALDANYFSNQPNEIPVLSYADFILVVRDDMPDDVAHLLAWCLCETRDSIERLYHHIPPERSPLSYPLEPRQMAKAPIPLHPGAEAYYREAALLDD